MQDVLKILEEDARTTPEQVAVMTGRPVEEVKQIIKQAEDDRVILGYRTQVNWEKGGKEEVWALIGLKAMPQRDVGFDALAQRISRFPEARSVYLVTGDYDLAIMVVAPTMQEVSSFVSRKLLTIEGVQGTVSHFVMQRYKDQGVTIDEEERPQRLAYAP